MLELTNHINDLKKEKFVEKIDEKLLMAFASGSRGELCPMQAIIGSITAQEVMKVFVLSQSSSIKLLILIFNLKYYFLYRIYRMLSKFNYSNSYRLAVANSLLSNNGCTLMQWNVCQLITKLC